MNSPSNKEKQPTAVNAASKTPGQGGVNLARNDHRVIGKAFRWPTVAMVSVLVAGGTAFFILKRQEPKEAAKMSQVTLPAAKPVTDIVIPNVRFTDITAEAGIQYVHNNGAYGDKLLPESMGGGVAFFDYDNDGDQDLLFINSTYWPDAPPPRKTPTTAALYQNDGRGQFKDVTTGSGLDVSIYGMGVAIGDFDRNGLPDVFITAVGENRLFQNKGAGKFEDVTGRTGVGGTEQEWSTSAAWFDIENDGDLDLFVCNYVRWSKEIDFEVNYTLPGIGRAYGPPMNFQGTYPYLYRNEGNWRFTDISKAAGVQISNPSTGAPAAKSLGVSPIDIDQDGWMDLIVANDTVQNFLLHNQKNCTFKEVGALAGIAFDSYGATRGAMGVDAGRFRGDNSLGIVIGNFANEMTALYVSHGNRLAFTDEAITAGIGPASRPLLKFGIFFFDYDLDGRLDILSSNGHLGEEITKVQKNQQYAQPAQLFWNTGKNDANGYVPVLKDKAGGDLFKTIVGRGSAYADIDSDGDEDVVLPQLAGAPLLLRNDQKLGHHWLRIKLVGTKSNPDAIGSWISVRAAGKTISRQVMPSKSYMSQSELPVTIGIGTADKIEAVQIVWPDGSKQTISSDQIKVDGLTTIKESD